ncbi:hypothetical protein N7462_007584 [Penicillium macrosclerotiorum]|uniref:uncharacterized protein n=1 Tax=Penicillium macrosclerotiorum TaxID=303699 RepID=UPI00254811B9|nr:uncharacterized protein N7462_007584 [Penicillium macrosclerotiorum]KAJ5679340.1 hypothetical protein N7462_007584 [Penicillium macrosclerotiorum]
MVFGLTMRGKGPVLFRTRPSLRSRRSAGLRWLGCVLFILVTLEVFSYLSRCPEISLVRQWRPYYRPAVLRPGQYRETTGIYHVLDSPTPQDVTGLDEMGHVNDQRDVRFYLGGTFTLTSSQHPGPDLPHPKPFIYDPYPAYNSRKWSKQYYGHFQPCLGPRGRNLDRARFEDMVLVYKGKQIGFPESRFGSHEAMGLDGDVCTDRYSRFGAYGYDDDSEEDVPGFTRPPIVPWSEVDWNHLQTLCLERNSDRYKPNSAMNQSQHRPLSFELREPPRKTYEPGTTSGERRYHPRSAVLIRAWHSMLWTTNHREYLRALIMGLSLHSGAEYEVFLLIHVKDDELPIFSDRKTVSELRTSIPPEFRNISLFFNNKLLEAWYPRISEHSPMLQHHQPLQVFSQLYPNFDYYWQFEMDGRHTGNIYHFLDRAISFAREQPRKYLWERNAYFYTPGAHGIWEEFKDMVNESLADRSDNTVWGPVYGTGIRPMGPDAPVALAEGDSFTWGVGEEADLITFLPIFNPKDTQWTFPDKIWNFKYGLDTPRRSAVITMGRYSRRLLDLIHHAQATRGLGLASEMTGASWALYHGLKAVHVPHPIYADGMWTSQELARIYNPGTPENINGGPDSIWNWDHLYDHIMYRLSYMFTTHTAEDLYRRWLGFRTAENEGGKRSSETRFGRLCYPSMFLHTIKNTDKGIGHDKAVP